MSLATLFKFANISPRIALTALLKNLETEVGHPITWFRLVYEVEKNAMWFEVLQPDQTKKRYTYPDGKTLIKAVESMSKDVLQKTGTLDVVVLVCGTVQEIKGQVYEATNNFTIECYYRNDAGEKLVNNFPL